MALMHLAADLAKSAGPPIHVATVDHGLREGSAAEALMAAAAARALGLPHRTLRWTGMKPATGVQEAARAARYFLLAAHAAEIGAVAMMTAHTADDQAETVLMRRARDSGPRGLAAMAASSLIAAEAGPSVILLRPMLGVRRSLLRAHLARIGARYVDDPGNDDPRFERIRVRRRIVAAEADGEFTVETLCAEAEARRTETRRAEAAQDRRFAALGGAFDRLGAVTLPVEGLRSEDAPLIARLLHAVSGAAHSPAEAASAAALDRALAGERATLGGATLSLRRDGRLQMAREAAALTGRAGVAPIAPMIVKVGERRLWDRRFIVANETDRAAEIRPLGPDVARYAIDADDATLMAAAPALFAGGAVLALAGESSAFTPLADERFFRRVNRFMRIT